MKAFFSWKFGPQTWLHIIQGSTLYKAKYGKSLSNNNNNLHSDSIMCQELLIHLIHTKNPTK